MRRAPCFVFRRALIKRRPETGSAVRGSQGLRGNDNAGHPLANFSGTSARIPEFRQLRGILSERPCPVPEIPEFRGDASRRPFRNSAGTPQKVAVLMEGPLRTLPTLPTLSTCYAAAFHLFRTHLDSSAPVVVSRWCFAAAFHLFRRHLDPSAPVVASRW